VFCKIKLTALKNLFVAIKKKNLYRVDLKPIGSVLKYKERFPADRCRNHINLCHTEEACSIAVLPFCCILR